MASLALDKRLFSLLAEEIVGYLPQFEPYSTDYQIVVYACKDFKEWLKWKMGIEPPRDVNEVIEEYLEKDFSTLRSLLKCWISLWVTKWKERVEVLANVPKPPQDIQKRINDARTLLQNTEYRKELKQLVMQKLLSRGEVCMVSFIAEQLITEEMARYSMRSNPAQGITGISLLDVFNSLSSRISKLSTEKGPLVYLSIKPHPI